MESMSPGGKKREKESDNIVREEWREGENEGREGKGEGGRDMQAIILFLSCS